MLRYQSRRHKALMDESEQALWTAADKNSGADARIARQILSDPRSHGLWEARHAELVLPVAEHTGRVPQVYALRDIEVRLVHRRALIDHIRGSGVKGRQRERLFRLFYGPREFQDAVIAEHRQYMLAVSSRVSADHLIDVMCDSVSNRLLAHYRTLYGTYFDYYCYVHTAKDSAIADAARPLMLEARRQAEDWRRQLVRVRPDDGARDFEHQALLARSGRYPVLNYMVG